MVASAFPMMGNDWQRERDLLLNFSLQRRECKHDLWSLLCPQSAAAIEVVEMWVWRAVSWRPDNAELFRSHGLLREAATKEKLGKLVCFTGWVVRGRWETVNIKFCLRSTGWNIFSLQDCRRIRPAKGFPAFVGLEGRRWLLGSQSTWSAHEETETQHAVDKVSIYSLHIQDLGILFVCSTGAVYSSLWALISDIFWCSQWWNVLWHPWQETQPFCKWKSVMF